MTTQSQPEPVAVTEEDRALLEFIYGGSFKFKPATEQRALAAIAMFRIDATASLHQSLAEAQAEVARLTAENERLRENAKANNTLARHEAAGRKQVAHRSAMLGNALEALIEAVERGDVTATDLADCRKLLSDGAALQETPRHAMRIEPAQPIGDLGDHLREYE